MITHDPTSTLDQRFSSPDAAARPWTEARGVLDEAQTYWLATVRASRRPHVTPLIAVAIDDAMYFCTGADEQKAKNIEQNPHCIILTGCNRLDEGFDVVVEGRAAHVTDERELHRAAAAYLAKYGEDWRFDVRDGAFLGPDNNVALVFRIDARKALGFGKGEPYSQTRWRF